MKHRLASGFLLAACVLPAQESPAARQHAPEPEANVGSPKTVRFPAPTNVQVEVSDEGTRVSWEPIRLKRIKQYDVFRLDGEKWVTIKPVLASAEARLTYTDPDIKKDEKRLYCVAAVDSSGAVGARSKPLAASSSVK